MRTAKRLLILVCSLGALCCAGERSAASTDLRGSVSDQVSHDDNLFRLSDAVLMNTGVLGRESQDVVNQATLSVDGTWSFNEQAWLLGVNVQDNRYSNNTDLDSVTGGAQLDWKWRALRRLNGDFRGTFSRSQASFANVEFYQKDLLSVQGYDGRIFFDINGRLRLLASGRYAETTHGAEARANENYVGKTGGGGLMYVSKKGNSITADHRYTKAEFAGPAVLNGTPFDRNYTERRSSIRLDYSPTAQSKLDLSAGHLQRNYPNAAIHDVSGEVGQVSFRWIPTKRITIEAGAWRDLQAVVEAESDYFISKGVRLEPTWSPTTRTTLALRGSWEERRFIGSDPASFLAARKEHLVTATAVVTYSVRQQLSLSLRYYLEQRDSNRLTREYDAEVVMAGIRFDWL